MDNLDKIKFKQSVPGWLIKIDDSGKTEFKEGTRYVNELQAWKDAENEIEPQFTTEEQAAKDQKEAAAAAISWIGERESEYIKEGCTEKALIVALWEKVVENRPEAADALEVKRQAVKGRILKPE